MNIFVGSLPFKIEEDELRSQFEKFGAVSSVKIITDKYSGRSKGFGFVEMPDDEQAAKAIESLNGSEVMGRKIVVNKAEERKSNGGGERRRDRRF
jgi:RNA recognition motif-containing protein